MQIQWYDHNTVIIKSKNSRIIINPINTETQKLYKSPKENDLLITTNRQDITVSQGFLINGAGEYSYQGATVRVASYTKNLESPLHLISLSVENILIAIVMGIEKELGTEELEFIGGPDILITSLSETFSSEKSLHLINAIEPRIVVPTYTADNQLKSLLSEYGSQQPEMEELSIKKIDLPIDSIQIQALKKQNNS